VNNRSDVSYPDQGDTIAEECHSYIKKMCHVCPGCALSNPGCKTSSELVYRFPIELPFWVIFLDAYKAGNHSSFEGGDVKCIFYSAVA
jgi:hypothetical protein